jgi:hypothetical protein
MPVFTTDAAKNNNKHHETRRIINEVVLWLGFVASVATLAAFIVLITDIANREGVSFKDIDQRLRKIEKFLLPKEEQQPPGTVSGDSVFVM